MGDWIYRLEPKSDWISLVFLLNLVVILILYKLDPSRLKSLINIFKPRFYFGKYSHEKEVDSFTYFNLFSFFIIVSTISLSYFPLSTYSFIKLEYSFEYLLLGINFILFFRHLLIQLISSQLGFQKIIKLISYKSFSFATQTSFFLIGLFFLWYYSTLPHILIECSLVLMGLYFFLNQFNMYFSFFKLNPEDLVYIIIYLCTFKLAPWIWIYILFVETKS